MTPPVLMWKRFPTASSQKAFASDERHIAVRVRTRRIENVDLDEIDEAAFCMEEKDHETDGQRRAEGEKRKETVALGERQASTQQQNERYQAEQEIEWLDQAAQGDHHP